MIKAMGGRETLEAVTDTTASGSMELIQMGMEGSVTVYTKRPDMMRMDIEVMGMTVTQAFDGNVAWGVNPQTGSVEEMPEDQTEQFSREALGDAVYLHPDKHGIVFTYKGAEKIEETEHHVLVMTYADGYTTTLFIDGKTNLIYKSQAVAPNMMTGSDSDVETIFSDYKELKGTMVSYSFTQFMDGEEFMIFTMDEIQYNTGLEDSLFEME
jgi:outer membrane lipoprotein-sorting protein